MPLPNSMSPYCQRDLFKNISAQFKKNTIISMKLNSKRLSAKYYWVTWKKIILLLFMLWNVQCVSKGYNVKCLVVLFVITIKWYELEAASDKQRKCIIINFPPSHSGAESVPEYEFRMKRPPLPLLVPFERGFADWKKITADYVAKLDMGKIKIPFTNIV